MTDDDDDYVCLDDVDNNMLGLYGSEEEKSLYVKEMM